MLAILLATYNGDRFLNEFLESLKDQTVEDWHLLVSDDGSTDKTADILGEWAERDSRIEILPTVPENLGPIGNFGRLVEVAVERGCDHVALADQDDVWVADKLQLQMHTLMRLQESAEPGTPLLVHTDAEVVDEQLRTIHPSHRTFAGHRQIQRANGFFDALLLTNFVTGCTVLVNRELLQLASPFPETIVMHDWWLALCAAAAGQIGYCPRATVRYRQHELNAVGAQQAFWKRVCGKLLNARTEWKRDLEVFRLVLSQAGQLRERTTELAAELPAGVTQSLDALCELFEQPRSPFVRNARLMSMGLPAAHPARKLAAYLRVTQLGAAAVLPPRAG